MARPRLLVLALVATALLALAGIASHGRPLAGRRGGGPTPVFFDYFFTSTVVVGAVVLIVATIALLSIDPRRSRPPVQRRWYLLSTFLSLAAAAAVAALLLHSGYLDRLRKLERQHAGQGQQTVPSFTKPAPKGTRNPRIRWDEIAVVAVLIAGTLVLLFGGARRRGALRRLPVRTHEAVAAALDESLDDLRADPDLRRAIIAAYARMERALARAGLPRRPAEAPFEYVERALRELDTGGDSARRLTGLFEWAKFSQHEPGPEMRDEAIAALVAVRDELAAPPLEAATA